MPKLNQVIAIEKGVKSKAVSEISDLYKAVQKPELFNGFVKIYESIDEDGKRLPQESKRVQFTVPDVLRSVERSMSDLFDITAKKDFTNCVAIADVVVDGTRIVGNAPVTYLLFLEKQLTDLRTFAAALPTLSADQNWSPDPNTGLFKSETKETHRLEKVQKPIVLVAPTPEHPAQAQLITEDVLAGYWKTTDHSGAIPKPEKDALVRKIDAVLKAVKEAREEANGCEVEATENIGAALFGFLFGT